MRFSRFEPRGRLKQQIRFQTTFLLTNRHSNQTKVVHRHTHVGSMVVGTTTIRSGGDTTLKGAQLIGKPNSSVPKIRPNGTVELFTDSKGVQIHRAVGVSPSDPMAVARDARSMPNIPTGSQARVIANNPYIPKPEGKFTIMDYLPEAARITKKGGEIVINGTPNNKYLRGIPNEAELARMGLRLKYNGPLKEEFKQLKFHDSNGANIRSQDFKTIVFEKVK